MRVTANLKAFVVAKAWVDASATDDQIKSAVGLKLMSGDLTPDKLAELTKEVSPPGQSIAALVATEVAKAVAGLSLQQPVQPAKDPIVAGVQKAGGPNPGAVLAEVAPAITPEIRVKSAVECYEHTKRQAIYPEKTAMGSAHPFANRPAVHMGRALDMPSDRDKAIAGAYFKFALASSCPEALHSHMIPRGLRMTDHDKDLIEWAKRNSSWVGVLNPRDDAYDWGLEINRRRLNDLEMKALIDDSTSGGIEIAPIEFDDMLVTTPVLFGELFPLVNVVNVTRGRRMKGGAIGNPTITSGTAEGTAITVFDTTSLVSAFDTTIYNAVGALEIGMDFEEDSPTNVGDIIMMKYGEKYMEWLDRVIGSGDGTTEPTGIFTASGTTLVPTDNGVGGPPTVSDYEALMFGVSKAYRNSKGNRNVFLGNDTSYRRARGIAVSPTDERRVFGLTHGDYRMLDTPYKVQNNLTNSQIGYCNMGWYRLYRRLGVSVRVETQGQTLALKNTRLIVCRARFGGKPEAGGAFAVSTDAQS